MPPEDEKKTAKKEDDTLINIKNNEIINIKNNIEKLNNFKINEEGKIIKDKINDGEIKIHNSFNENNPNNTIENKKNPLFNNFNNDTGINDKNKFKLIEDKFKKIVKDFIGHKLKISKIKEGFKNSLNIFEELNKEITNFNNETVKAFLTQNTDLKKYLSNSLINKNTKFVKEKKKYLKKL